MNKGLIWCVVGVTLNSLLSSLAGWSYVFDVFYLEQEETARAAFYIAVIISFFSFAALRENQLRNVTGLSIVAACVGVLGVGFLVISTNQSLVPPYVFGVAGSFCLGLSYAWLFLGFFDVIGRTFTFKQINLISVSFLTYSFFSVLLFHFTPPFAQRILLAVLIICICICSIQARKHAAATIRKDIINKPAEQSRLLQIVLLGLSFVAAQSFTVAGLWGHKRWGNSLEDILPIIVAGIALLMVIPIASFIFRACLKKPLHTPYYLPQTIIVMSFVLIIFLEPLDIPVLSERNSMFLLYFVAYFAEATFFFAILSSARVMRFSLEQIGGFSYGILWLIALVWSLFFENVPDFALVLILVGALLGIVLLVVSGTKTSNALSLEEQCASISSGNNLTKRESEILELLAQGRSVPHIKAELFLSEGTIRNHITNIYRKLGVQSRQELLDLFQ